ncbi:hypothetical protein VTN02DRAFT_5107 [Thermoascus thermophilus]
MTIRSRSPPPPPRSGSGSGSGSRVWMDGEVGTPGGYGYAGGEVLEAGRAVLLGFYRTSLPGLLTQASGQ